MINNTNQNDGSLAFTQDMCRLVLSLSNINTLYGKFEMSINLVLFLLIISSNGLFIYGMHKTNEIKNNTGRLSIFLIFCIFLSFLLYIYYFQQKKRFDTETCLLTLVVCNGRVCRYVVI